MGSNRVTSCPSTLSQSTGNYTYCAFTMEKAHSYHLLLMTKFSISVVEQPGHYDRLQYDVFNSMYDINLSIIKSLNLN